MYSAQISAGVRTRAQIANQYITPVMGLLFREPICFTEVVSAKVVPLSPVVPTSTPSM
jgi:hypothetical protein